MKQTKIVASISDRKCDQDFIRKLFFAGMNVVRMNTAHATEEGIRTIVKNVRAVSPHIGIMIDTKGPEVRTTGVKEPIHYNVGDVVKIFGRPEMESSHDIVNVSYPDIAADVKVGDDLLFDEDYRQPGSYAGCRGSERGSARGSQERECAGRAYRPACTDRERPPEY